MKMLLEWLQGKPCLFDVYIINFQWIYGWINTNLFNLYI
jgi:hypothetical protein